MQRRAFLGLPAAALVLGGCEQAASIRGGFTGTNDQRGHALRDLSSMRQPPAPQVTHQAQVVIAGGGVAGLAAARALRLRGIDDFALLELEDFAGGNSRAGQVGGITCPLGAHYLPVPGDDAHEVQDLLEELGLRQRKAGRWVYDERHLCHSPQERLFFEGAWQEGLLPVHGVGADTLAQYQRFAQRVAQLQQQARFSMPAARAPFTPTHQALDAVTFAHWLNTENFSDPHLRWYLDYCCRDDFGAGTATVSAWAGIHYFASRHGFHAPGDEASESEGVLTWPEGNGWLTQRLAAPLGDRLHTGSTVLRIRELRHGVEVDALNHSTQTVERWQAQQCIVALPVFIAARVVENPPAVLTAAAARLRYAPWCVANIHIDAPLQDHPGAAPAWDNVVYGEEGGQGGGLGYVDARHQTLDPRPGPTVLTYYQALGDLPNGRRQLLEQPWSHWRDQVLAALSVPHPDLPEHATRMDITRYGHAMAVPQPGNLSQIMLQRTGDGRKQLSKQEYPAIHSGRLQFAHADWSGYSVFEEAFTRGHAAGMGV